jgi:glycosyltransferase involved in cell wall biosynthesis
VPARSPQQVITDMAVAMDALSESPSRRAVMGHAARARVRERFNTSALRQHFNRWYREVVVPIHRQPDHHAVSTAVSARDAFLCPTAPQTKPSPVVSAVMSTYNKGPWLQQAIDSVLHQTFTDWELIIVDDGSTDNTAEVLAACSDPRITIDSLSTIVGRAKARNVALERARGRYIAICDSDDVSAPTRFERHVSFLDAHPEVGVVSGYIRQLSDRHAARIVFPLDHEAIARRFARGKMGAAHGAAMIRSACFEQLGFYLDDLRSAEDFELFRRFCQRFRFHTLPEELLLYRNRLGTVPLREWAEASRAHRYALYRSNCQNSGMPALSFDEFVHSWRTNVAVYTVDSLRFAHFNLRAHVFSSHVLR